MTAAAIVLKPFVRLPMIIDGIRARGYSVVPVFTIVRQDAGRRDVAL